MKKLIILWALAFVPSGFGKGAETITKSFPANKIQRLIISNTAGNVMVTGQSTPEAKVIGKKKKFGPDCEMKIDLQEDTLFISVSSKSDTGWDDGGVTCEVDLLVEVPKRIKQQIKNGAGNVMISSTKGNIVLTSGAGEMDLTEIESDELDVRAGAGDLKVQGVLKNAEIRLGAGDLEMALNKTPKKGLVDINTGTGSAIVRVPKNAKIQTQFKSGLGQLDSEVENDSSSRYVISLKSGTGDMSVRTL